MHMVNMSRSSSEARRAIRSAWLLFLFILLAVLLCVAHPARFSRASTPAAEPSATEPGLPLLGGQNKAVEAARIDLARHINVDVALISVDTVEPRWWPNSCLGRPRPNEACATVRTPGFRVVLAAGEYRFIYRTDLSGENVRLEDLVTSLAQFPVC